MPIINYESAFETSFAKLLSSEKISDANKKVFSEYITGVKRNRKPATLNKVCRNIKYFLEAVPDVAVYVDDNLTDKKQSRNEINKVFDDFSKRLTKSYFSTVVNVSNAFMKWLNDGSKPYSFKDVLNVKKNKQMRDLNRSDMWTLKDRDAFRNATNSLQMKAVISFQLDAGLRPSEFIDLNISDVHFDGVLGYVTIKESKTGKSRQVIIKNSVPDLSKWISNHPLKTGSDEPLETDTPLWVQESRDNKHKRYKYASLRSKVDFITKEAGINKPSDFYLLRHSAIFQAKCDNTPVDIGAEKFGHSVNYYQNVYGRLDPSDKLNKFRKFVKDSNLKTGFVCEVCNTLNSDDKVYCEKCRTPLTLGLALELKKKQESESAGIKAELLAEKDARAKLEASLLVEIRKNKTEMAKLENSLLEEIRKIKKL